MKSSLSLAQRTHGVCRCARDARPRRCEDALRCSCRDEVCRDTSAVGLDRVPRESFGSTDNQRSLADTCCASVSTPARIRLQSVVSTLVGGARVAADLSGSSLVGVVRPGRSLEDDLRSWISVAAARGGRAGRLDS